MDEVHEGPAQDLLFGIPQCSAPGGADLSERAFVIEDSDQIHRMLEELPQLLLDILALDSDNTDAQKLLEEVRHSLAAHCQSQNQSA